MEDLFLFYMTINILLVIKIVYGIKVIMKGFKKYTNTNRVLTNLTYGTISFFYVAFSIVQATGITEDKDRLVKPEYTGIMVSGAYIAVSCYFVLIAKHFNLTVRRRRQEAKIEREKEEELIQQEAEEIKREMDRQEADEGSDGAHLTNFNSK